MKRPICTAARAIDPVKAIQATPTHERNLRRLTAPSSPAADLAVFDAAGAGEAAEPLFAAAGAGALPAGAGAG